MAHFLLPFPPLQPPGAGPLRILRDWLGQRWKPRSARRSAARQAPSSVALAQAALEACAVEGSELLYGHTDIDGRRYAALFRRGELVGLLPPEP